MSKMGIRLNMGLFLIPFLLISCSNEEKTDNKENIVVNKEQSKEKTIEIHTMFEVAYYGKFELIQRYLDHNHSINQEDSTSQSTPIYYAIQANKKLIFTPFKANPPARYSPSRTVSIKFLS